MQERRLTNEEEITNINLPPRVGQRESGCKEAPAASEFPNQLPEDFGGMAERPKGVDSRGVLTCDGLAVVGAGGSFLDVDFMTVAFACELD